MTGDTPYRNMGVSHPRNLRRLPIGTANFQGMSYLWSSLLKGSYSEPLTIGRQFLCGGTCFAGLKPQDTVDTVLRTLSLQA